MSNWKRSLAAAAAAWLALACGAAAQDLETFRVAIGQGGKWDASVVELGTDQGFFEEQGLEIELIYTEGGGETQQIVISDSADIGIAIGTQGAMAAFAKGAPIRIIGSAATGDDAYYFVKADSDIESMSDLQGETLAYSREGSSTHSFALGFVNLLGVDAELVATGGPPSTLTAVMSDQVDVGWSAPPFGLEQIQEGDIRVIARSNELPNVEGHTVRLIITNLETLEEQGDLVDAFMEGYRATIEWMYTTDEALEAYAELAGVDVETARMIREEFDTREYIDPDQMRGVANLMDEALTLGYIDEPLTEEQLDELILVEGWEM